MSQTRCLWCGEPLRFIPGKGWVHQDGKLYKEVRRQHCPYCKSRKIIDKGKTGLCLNCNSTFDLYYDDHCAMPDRR